MRDDTTYFYARAETELELAQRATHPEAVRAHYIIANHYLDRCYGGSETTVADGDPPGGEGAGGPADKPGRPD